MITAPQLWTRQVLREGGMCREKAHLLAMRIPSFWRMRSHGQC